MLEIKKSPKKCPVCKKMLSEDMFKYNNFEWDNTTIFDNLYIKHCLHCGFGFSFPDLDESLIELFYRHDYRKKGEPYLRKIEYHLDHRSIAQIFLSLQYCNWEKGDVFLDIGPGAGTSFSSALSILDEPVLAAIEFAQEALSDYERLYGVKGFNSISDGVTKLKRKPKIILSSHCLEHFTFNGAVKFINEVKKCLDPNGVLIIEVPAEDFKDPRVINALHAPHFLFFTKKSLKKLLESSGFEIKFIDTCSLEFDFIEKLNNSDKKIPTAPHLDKSIKAFLKNIIKRFLLLFNKRGRVLLKDNNFRYGGDRICLRVVAVKKKY